MLVSYVKQNRYRKTSEGIHTKLFIVVFIYMMVRLRTFSFHLDIYFLLINTFLTWKQKQRDDRTGTLSYFFILLVCKLFEDRSSNLQSLCFCTRDTHGFTPETPCGPPSVRTYRGAGSDTQSALNGDPNADPQNCITLCGKKMSDYYTTKDGIKLRILRGQCEDGGRDQSDVATKPGMLGKPPEARRG